VRAASPSPAPLNSYVHLVGVYDATAKKILLYVDGQLTASAPFDRAWNATGPLILGRGTHRGAPADFWSGDLDEVHVFAGVVTDVTRIP